MKRNSIQSRRGQDSKEYLAGIISDVSHKIGC